MLADGQREQRLYFKLSSSHTGRCRAVDFSQQPGYGVGGIEMEHVSRVFYNGYTH